MHSCAEQEEITWQYWRYSSDRAKCHSATCSLEEALSFYLSHTEICQIYLKFTCITLRIWQHWRLTDLKFQEAIAAMTGHIDEDIAAIIREKTFWARSTWRQTTCQHSDEILHCYFIATIIHLTHKPSVSDSDGNNKNKKLIRRWDSERELFYDDIMHILQSTCTLAHKYEIMAQTYATPCLL